MPLLELDRPTHRRSIRDLDALRHFERLLAAGPKFGTEGRRRARVLDYLTELHDALIADQRRFRSWMRPRLGLTIRRRA